MPVIQVVAVICFNPTLVRLRRAPQLRPKLGQDVPFQSHAGSIEADLRLIARSAITFVSIPRWFD